METDVCDDITAFILQLFKVYCNTEIDIYHIVCKKYGRILNETT